jgi:hypothetical protein
MDDRNVGELAGPLTVVADDGFTVRFQGSRDDYSVGQLETGAAPEGCRPSGDLAVYTDDVDAVLGKEVGNPLLRRVVAVAIRPDQQLSLRDHRYDDREIAGLHAAEDGEQHVIVRMLPVQEVDERVRVQQELFAPGEVQILNQSGPPLGAITLFPKLPDVGVLLLTGPAVEATEATAVILHPVPRTSPEHQTITLPADSQAVSGTQAHLPEKLDRQRDLVLAAYGSQGGFLPSAHDVLCRGLPDFTMMGFAL